MIIGPFSVCIRKTDPHLYFYRRVTGDSPLVLNILVLGWLLIAWVAS